MAAGQTIRIEGLDKVLKGMRNYSDQKKKGVDEIFKSGAEKIRNKALRRVPVNEGALKNSITINRIKEGYEVVVQSETGIFLETGTKSYFQVDSEFAGYVSQFKGQRTGGRGFFESILDWVRSKNIKFQVRGKSTKRQKRMTDEQVAMIIMRSIQEHGIHPHPYLLNSFVEVRTEMIHEIIELLRA